MMENIELHQISETRCTLGEGVRFDEATQRLSWLDIPQSRTYERRSDGRIITASAGDQVAFVLRSTDGRTIAGGSAGLHLSDRANVVVPPGMGPQEALNDGAVHPSGRWTVFGSRDLAEQAPYGHVWLLGSGIAVLPWRVTVFNGPAFTSGGDAFYFTDSPSGHIWRVPFDPESGAVGAREVFTTVPPEAGFPDGMICDDEGCLWSAHWEGGCVRRYDPDGCLMRTVPLPFRNATSLAFWGAERDQLAVTSALPEGAEPGLQDGHTFSFATNTTGPAAPRLVADILNPL